MKGIKTMPTKSCSDIASRHDGKIMVAASTINSFQEKGMATVFDLIFHKLICEFPIRYENQGVRLAISRDDNILLAGCYNAHGIAGYSIADGSELWRRKDLKSVQDVETMEFQDWVFCGREKGAAYLLETKTGATVEKFTGVRSFYGSPFDQSIVLLGRSLELHRPFGTKIKTFKSTKYLRQCAFSPTEVLVSDTESIRCFDLNSGELIWSHIPEKEFDYKQFSWSDRHRCFIAIKDKEKKPSFVHLHPNKWELLKETKFLGCGLGRFCLKGGIWADGNLCLYSADTGEFIHDFTTDEILRRDPKHKHDLLVSLADNSESPEELEHYMKLEGFNAQEIKKAVFLKTMEHWRKDRPKS